MTATGETVDPSDATLISDFVDYEIAGIHTAMPCEVLMFHPERNAVDLQPSFKSRFSRADGSIDIASMPVLLEVPVLYPRGGGFRLTWPLKPGDRVYCVFAERALDKWRIQGGEIDPVWFRKHALSDGVALPGLCPDSDLIYDRPGVPLSLTDLVLGAEDGSAEVRIKPDGSVEVTGATVALGDATGGASVGREGDSILISPDTDPTFFAYLATLATAIAGKTPASAGVPPAYTTPITGKISSGSAKVKAT